jgi:ribonuclease HI
LSNLQHQRQSLEQQKPDAGWYKCNADVGFQNVINKISVGWYLRDWRGSFVLAGTVWMDGLFSIAEGESIAILEAMKVIIQRGFSKVIFKTDSKSTVDAIHALRGGTSEFSSLICLIQNVLLCSSNFMVKFIKRQTNIVVHTLAKTIFFYLVTACLSFYTLILNFYY